MQTEIKSNDIFKTDEIRKSLFIKNSHYRKALKGYLRHENYVNVFHNAQHKDFSEEGPKLDDLLISDTNIRLSLSYPVHASSSVDIRDKCIEFFNEQKAYEVVCDKSAKALSKDDLKLNANDIKLHDYLRLPQYLLGVTNLNKFDETFNGGYDYYFTGGTLSKTTIYDKKYLVFPNCDNKIYLINPEDPKDKFTFPHNTDDVCNIKCNEEKYILIRQKGCLDLYKLPSKKKFKAEHVKSIEAKSLDASLLEENIYYIDASHKFYRQTINNRKPVKLFQLPITDKQFSNIAQFHLSDNNEVLLIDHKTSYLYDLRSVEFQTTEIKDGFFKCNNLCQIVKSDLNETIFYITSKHKVYKLDKRQMRIVNAWSHYLKHSPIVGKLAPMRDTEHFLISSFDEIVCLPMGEFCSVLPFEVPTISQTYEKAMLHHTVLLNQDLARRVQLSLCGLEIQVTNEDEISLFSMNSIGDVFRNDIGYTLNVDTSKIYQKFEEWGREFENIAPQLRVTHVKNMSDAKKSLKKTCGKRNLQYLMHPNNRCNQFLKRHESKYEYSHFAALWQDSDSDEDPQAKVSEWFENPQNVFTEDNDNSNDLFQS